MQRISMVDALRVIVIDFSLDDKSIIAIHNRVNNQIEYLYPQNFHDVLAILKIKIVLYQTTIIIDGGKHFNKALSMWIDEEYNIKVGENIYEKVGYSIYPQRRIIELEEIFGMHEVPITKEAREILEKINK